MTCQILTVDAGSDVRDEGVELVESGIVVPMGGEKAVGGVEPGRRDTGIREDRRKRICRLDADIARVGEDGAGRQY